MKVQRQACDAGKQKRKDAGQSTISFTVHSPLEQFWLSDVVCGLDIILAIYTLRRAQVGMMAAGK